MSGEIYQTETSASTKVLVDTPAERARLRTTPVNSPFLSRLKRTAEDAPRETPRGKRERIHRHYSKVLSMCLSALYDGKPKRFPGRDYIEYVISALGYDKADEWLYITDEDLIKSNIVGLRVRDDVAIAREIDRIQKQRERLNAAQAEAGNPIVIEFEAEYDAEAKKNRSKYKRPICELVRDVVAECPVGTRDDRLRVVVAVKAAEYLRRFDGEARTAKRKREHSADSDAGRAATFALGAYRKQEIKSGEADAVLLIRNAFKSKFGAELYTLIFAENGDFQKIKSLETQDVAASTCTTIVPRVAGPEMVSAGAGLCCEKNIKPAPQYGPPSPPVIVGQSVEDFIAENPHYQSNSLPETFPSELDVDGGPVSYDTNRGPTERQRELISRTGHIVPSSRDEATALIGRLIADNAFSTFLSLSDLETYDSNAGGRNRKERRFLCPLCGHDKPGDDEHRSLSLNTATGEYFCHRCNVAGVLKENQNASGSGRAHIYTGPPEPKSEKWREWWAKAEPVAGTPGGAYLESRGVPLEAATAAGVKFGTWWKRGQAGPEKFNAVLFPVLDADGQLVAVIARGLVGKTMRTGGDIKQGVFRATLDATNANRIAITESPIDGLILAAVGLDSVATGGTHWPEWLPGALHDKDVALAQDADRAGDECAAGLASLLPTSWRLRPVGYKDWAEVAEWAGLDSVAEVVMDAQERAPEVTQ